VSSGFSFREVERIKRWVIDKDREEKKRNIIIRGINIPKEMASDGKKSREWVAELLILMGN